MSILIGTKEEMKERYFKNCKIADEALSYISIELERAKEENKNINMKLKTKLEESEVRSLLFTRMDNAQIIRCLKPLVKTLATTKHTGVIPDELIEDITQVGRITATTEHYLAIAEILNNMEYFPEEYY